MHRKGLCKIAEGFFSNLKQIFPLLTPEEQTRLSWLRDEDIRCGGVYRYILLG